MANFSDSVYFWKRSPHIPGAEERLLADTSFTGLAPVVALMEPRLPGSGARGPPQVGRGAGPPPPGPSCTSRETKNSGSSRDTFVSLQPPYSDTVLILFCWK